MAALQTPDSTPANPPAAARLATWRPWVWAAPAILVELCVGLLVSWRGGGFAATARWPDQQALFLSLNATFADGPAPLWAAITLMGDTAVLLALLTLLLNRRPQVWAALLAAIPAGALLSASLKHWAAVPRPAAVLDPAVFNVIGPLLHHNSFPSGHTLSAFAAAAAILATLVPAPRCRMDGAVLGVGLFAAAMIALSRVAVGAHWPLDLAAGAAAGWLAGLSGAALARRTGWWRWLLLGAGRRASGAGLALWGLLLWLRPHETITCAVVLGVAGACAVWTGLQFFRTGGPAHLAHLAQLAASPAPAGSADQRPGA